jgi:hypothetical protein
MIKAYAIATSIEELNSRLWRLQPVRVTLVFPDRIGEGSIYELGHKDVVFVYTANKDGSPKIIEWGHWHIKSKIVKRGLWKDKPVSSR